MAARLRPILVFIVLASLGAGAVRAAPAGGATASYADELVARAGELKLAGSDEWAALLHLIKNPLRQRQSEAAGPGFFIAENGNLDPDAELAATLRAFFEPPIVEVVPEAEAGDSGERGLQHPQCRFPARYLFLKHALSFDPLRLREQECPRFADWLDRVDAGPAYIVFAAAYVNHPSSAFGHTFLRFDKRSAPGQPLLGYAVNYAARATTSNGLLYAILGLTGAFRGYFSILPTYLKTKEYSDVESRDLWDYPLLLTAEEQDRMLRHIWELGTTWFDYWFTKENCSYHVLSLLEVARPGVKLREQFHTWVVPIGTLRALEAVPHLLGTPVRRASLDTRMKARRAQLSTNERALAYQLGAGSEQDRGAALEKLAALGLDRQAAALDAALDLQQWRLGDEAGDEQVTAAAQRALVFRRARAAVPSQDLEPPRLIAPDLGHRIPLLLLGGGSNQGTPFAALTWRAVLHDLISAAEGQMPDQQVEMGRLELRLPLDLSGVADLKRISVHEFRLLRIESLDPVDGWTPKAGWRFGTGFARERLDGKRLRFWEARGGPALSVEPLGQLVYAAADVEVAGGPDFRHWFRLRGRPTAGLVLRAGDFFKLRFEAAALWDVEDRASLRPQLTVEQAFNLGRWQLRTAALWSRDDWTLQAGLGLYY